MVWPCEESCRSGTVAVCNGRPTAGIYLGHVAMKRPWGVAPPPEIGREEKLLIVLERLSLNIDTVM